MLLYYLYTQMTVVRSKVRGIISEDITLIGPAITGCPHIFCEFSFERGNFVNIPYISR